MLVRAALLLLVVIGDVSRGVGCLVAFFLSKSFFLNVFDNSFLRLRCAGVLNLEGFESFFEFLSSCSSCESLSSPFKFSCFVFILFLVTRFGGGLSFRVFCVAVLMLLSLIICCLSIFLLIPFFDELMADSASLVSISFLSSSIFILSVVWLMLSLFFHCLALFLFFFFFALSLSTVHCIACRAHC